MFDVLYCKVTIVKGYFVLDLVVSHTTVHSGAVLLLKNVQAVLMSMLQTFVSF